MSESFRLPLLFGELMYGLRVEGVSVGPQEWLGLMEALAAGAVDHSLEDFYYVARALLLKSEADFDTYDQVFAKVFRGKDIPPGLFEELLDWLQNPVTPDMVPQLLQQLEKLPLEELRRLFEERLREQTERHDRGSRWIGTGGRSPFGHGGAHPGGVRVGGGGGQRTAVQIATARHFEKYRHDRVLDTRSISVALKKLRRLSRRHADLELDIDGSIEDTGRNAGELSLRFSPPRKNEARVILLMDTGGSMDPYSHLVERLFSAAHGLQHWRRFEAYSFHNCVYEKLEPGRPEHDDEIMTAELLRERPSESFVIFVGDAYMAPSELLDPWGAIHYYHHNPTPGIVWLHRLRTRFPRSIWLNPIPETGWHGWTIKIIRQIFPMFPLTVDGIDGAVSQLVRKSPAPLRSLGEMYPDLREYENRPDSEL